MRSQDQHEFFIELAVRATIEDLSETERQQYETHLNECEDCRVEVGRLDNLYCSALLAEHTATDYWELPESSVIEGDLAEVVTPHPKNGSRLSVTTLELPLSLPLEPSAQRSAARSAASRNGAGRFLRPVLAAAAGIVLVLVSGKLGYDGWREKSLNRQQAVEMARLHSKITDLESRLSDSDRDRTDSLKHFQAELSVSHDLNSKNLADLEGQLKSSELKAQSLAQELSAAQVSHSELTGRLQQEQSHAAQLRTELEAAHSKKAQESLAAQDKKEARIAQLEIMLAAEKETVDRDERLLTADRDIRNLMGARDLHIIDVMDVNGDGRSAKSFGRVFYTQGKSLIFYAFDLGADQKRKKVMDAAFQVWGVHRWERQSARSLGIFYQDEKDKGANRWVLKFDDPNVLEQIDSVFVTLEPQGGSKRPTGRELLSAYLNSKVNHP